MASKFLKAASKPQNSVDWYKLNSFLARDTNGMETHDNIHSSIEELEKMEQTSNEVAAIIRLAPDSGNYVLGNRRGYIRLAISALKAATGQDQSFKAVPWVVAEDWDWGFSGLKYDVAAHEYLPSKRSGWQKLLGIFVMLILAACFLTGLFTIGFGLFRLLR